MLSPAEKAGILLGAFVLVVVILLAIARFTRKAVDDPIIQDEERKP